MALNLTVPRTRLLVRALPKHDGCVAPVVTDLSGVPLPNQRRIALDYDDQGGAQVTVTFAIDGDDIRLMPSGPLESER